MPNATIATVSPVNTHSPSSKLVDYLIRSNADDSLSPEENYRRIIEAAFEHATTKRRKHIPADEIASNYAKHSVPLMNRLMYFREHARNTARKITKGLPDEVKWVNGYAPIVISGIYSGGKDITSEVAAGTVKVSKSDVVKFSVGAHLGQVPVKFLTYDPMAASQYVRRLAKAYAVEVERENVRTLSKKKSELAAKKVSLEKQAAAAQAELDELIRKNAPKVKKPDSRLVSA